LSTPRRDGEVVWKDNEGAKEWKGAKKKKPVRGSLSSAAESRRSSLKGLRITTEMGGGGGASSKPKVPGGTAQN
jgi:hypothetical protein